MPSRSDYRCGCGELVEKYFDGTPPPYIMTRCHCTPNLDRDDYDSTIWKRVWGAPHTGRGSSGEPAR